MAEQFINDETLKRRINQHWEMAGLARQDGDDKDAAHHLEEVRRYRQLLEDARKG